jgi:hypothetical protein
MKDSNNPEFSSNELHKDLNDSVFKEFSRLVGRHTTSYALKRAGRTGAELCGMEKKDIYLQAKWAPNSKSAPLYEVTEADKMRDRALWEEKVLFHKAFVRWIDPSDPNMSCDPVEFSRIKNDVHNKRSSSSRKSWNTQKALGVGYAK